MRHTADSPAVGLGKCDMLGCSMDGCVGAGGWAAWDKATPAAAIVSSLTSCGLAPVPPVLLPCVCRCCTTHAHRYNADLERVVRARVRRGRHFPIMKVIPPGLDFSNLKISPPPDPLEALNPHGSGEGRG